MVRTGRWKGRRWGSGLVVALAACGSDATTVPLPGDPDDDSAPWIEVAAIEREPRLPPPDSLAPPDAGWPEPGSDVAWVARILNRGDVAAPSVAFRWAVEGQDAGTGTVDLPPGETRVSLRRAWTGERERVAFTLLPDTSVDRTTGDDTLTVYSDALSVGFWVHRSIYDWMRDEGRGGFERQAQRWLADWNALLGRDTWPSAPAGVLDRMRLERIEIVPDAMGYPPDVDTDFVWFFRLGADPRFLGVGSPERERADQAIVLHELLHQRGMTDLYAYEVQHDSPNGSHVGITENGRLVAGTAAMPFVGAARVYAPDLNGIMGSLYRLAGTRVTEHTAFGMNERAGRRTPRWGDAFGNQNNGFQMHGYVNRMPDTTDVRLRTSGGATLGGARVELFLDHGDEFYKDVYRADPDFVFEADDDGVFGLPGDVLDGTFTADEYPKSWTLILRVTTGSGRAYAFLPGYVPNVLWFRGDRERGSLTVTADPR